MRVAWQRMRVGLGIAAWALTALTGLTISCGADSAGSGYCCLSDEECGPNRVCDQCQCKNKCTGPADCPEDMPNCNPDTGLCVGACPDTACPDPALPNCSAEGLCVGLCQDDEDCTHPDTPRCDPDTGLCVAACTSNDDCPTSLPNCNTVSGLCFPPCSVSDDCLDPNAPVCDPATGICQGPCPTTPCPSDLPNCNSLTGQCLGLCDEPGDCLDPTLPNCGTDGICVGPCTSNSDCPLPDYPNCGADGVCFGPCTAHADCTLPAAPNCSLDASAVDVGQCGPPCTDNGDCDSPRYPNCDPTPGTCDPPCTGDGDCPSEFWKCATSTGLCFLPECTQDSECNPPTTVCESWFCVPGCTDHSDCATTERCDLRDAGNLYHCEPRDCTDDTDCNPPTTVCDTDGLADPNGGGYCEPGCETDYDCRQLGYDCTPAQGTCSPHDYGDIGQPCTSGCSSGFCLTGQGNVCTDFCCSQNDCPAGWMCRPQDDTTGGSHTVDVCVPAPTGQGMGRFGEACAQPDDCRSGVCLLQTCRDSCCTDADCDQSVVPGTYCSFSTITSPTVCINEPATGNDPVGTLGCGTTGTPGDCHANLCFTNYQPDTACTTNTDCPAEYPICYDYAGAGAAGVTDCVHDMCVGQCCSADDCPSTANDDFFCGKWLFSPGDMNICLVHYGTGLLGEGAACTNNGECRSNFCNLTGTGPQVCRHRCCTDADCTDASTPNCALELHTVFGVPRQLNVCQ